MALAFAALINCEFSEKFPDCECLSCRRFNSLQHEHLHMIVPLPTLSQNSKDTLDKKSIDIFIKELDKKRNNLFHKIRIPKSTRIILQSIRNLRKSLYLRSALKGRKIAVIFESELLCTGSGESANALLKILEEPPQSTTLILVTDFKDKLFPTIISRCQHIQFPPLEDNIVEGMLKEKGIDDEKIKWISFLSEGNFVTASSIADKNWGEINTFFNFISDLMIADDYKKLYKFASDYTNMSRTNTPEFQFHFYLIQRWLLGALHLKNGIHDSLTETDLGIGINRFLSRYPGVNLYELNMLVDSVLEGFNQNANMALLLTNFIIQLQRELGKTNTR
tara:strand:+ start:135916 stop:136920 length:1005 start_codon:yes stop_codon:yes gene_type:complete